MAKKKIERGGGCLEPPHTRMTVLPHAEEEWIHLHKQVKKVLKKTTIHVKGQKQLSLQIKIKTKAIPETGEAS